MTLKTSKRNFNGFLDGSWDIHMSSFAPATLSLWFFLLTDLCHSIVTIRALLLTHLKMSCPCYIDVNSYITILRAVG